MAAQGGVFIPPSIKPFFAANRSPPKDRDRTWVADPPPFGTSSSRFAKNTNRGSSPDYHVAYRDVNQPPRWTTKGWAGIDDSIKPGRGTSHGKFSSSLAPKGAGQARHGPSLQPLMATYPNETRLQELLDLQRRKLHGMPGPGTYEAPESVPARKTFRRPHYQPLDGPFLPGMAEQREETTREREISSVLRNPGDHDLAPGDYDSHLGKDHTFKEPVGAKIGTGDRTGRTKHTKTLSVSRSIQHGIDWHVPVIVQLRPAPSALKASGVGSAGAAGTEAGAGPEGTEGGPGTSGQTAEPGPLGLPREYIPPTSASQQQAAMNELLPQVSPRYLDPSPPKDRGVLLGAPPQPPPHVARSVRKGVGLAPGDWDWSKLGKNYRNNWTTLHGGAYTNGDKLLRLPNSAPELSTPAPDLSNMESIDPTQLPPVDQARDMFPIPEEDQAQYKDIGRGMSPANSPSLKSPIVLQRGQTAGSSVAFGGSGNPTLPVGSVISQKDLEQHMQAVQAATIAQQLAQRRQDWQQRFAGF